VSKQVRVYYSSGGDHEPGHVLLVGDADLEHLRTLQKRAAACFALAGNPDCVGWMETVGNVTEARNFNGADELQVQDAIVAAMSDSAGIALVDEELVAQMEPARTEAWEVKFYVTQPLTAQVEWRAKHADSSNYFAAVNLEDG